MTYSLQSFLSSEESHLLEIVSKSSLTEDKKLELELIVIPSVKEGVEKILKSYLGTETDMRLLWEEKIVWRLCEDLDRVEWALFESLSKRIESKRRELKDKLEEGYKELIIQKMKSLHSLEEWMTMKKKEKGEEKITIWNKSLWLVTIATRLSIGWNPIESSEVFKELMTRIYGESEVAKYSHLLKTRSKK